MEYNCLWTGGSSAKGGIAKEWDRDRGEGGYGWPPPVSFTAAAASPGLPYLQVRPAEGINTVEP